jgi:hypothetical protein
MLCFATTWAGGQLPRADTRPRLDEQGIASLIYSASFGGHSHNKKLLRILKASDTECTVRVLTSVHTSEDKVPHITLYYPKETGAAAQQATHLYVSYTVEGWKVDSLSGARAGRLRETEHQESPTYTYTELGDLFF